MPAEHTTRLVYPSPLRDPSLSSKTPIDGMDTFGIVGLAVGVVAVLLIVVASVWLVYRRRQCSKNAFTDLDLHSFGMEGGITPPQEPPCIHIAVFMHVLEQGCDSRFFLDRENLPSPDGSYTYSIFFNCKFKCIDRLGLRDLSLSPSSPNEIQEFYATTQRHDGETSIDAILYADIDARTQKMIESVAVPRLRIPKSEQPPNNQGLTSGIIPQIIAMILENRQKAEKQNIRDHLFDRNERRRSSMALNVTNARRLV
ncbi:hypothetical protein EDB81DRAFT_893371 [Dactylonectria macrodidyma]|uniref:Uncharacterized protein n=1 Tax=Dactylonectria macrodidyma TaxID=307937 RepID=A0A9P9IBY3_9HYPO|nr:hypothetical protein EDB81DRAFT_893371 [Dactylonectria macrodidyma]